MKIIAEVNGSTYLAQITEDELAIIQGYRNSNLSAYKKAYIGREYNVEKLGLVVQQMCHSKNKAKDATKMLKEVLGVLDNLDIPQIYTAE